MKIIRVVINATCKCYGKLKATEDFCYQDLAIIPDELHEP